MAHEHSSTRPTFIRLQLTSEQQAQVRSTFGIESNAIELSVSELEERIAPRVKLTDILVSG